ncbi:phage late control D family protein [Stenotrophomonas maltophilia]|uniref:phage late control D family protein n=1 Tax=Stenotrophomonas maltophilia TaxID=40324 RepID=UPI0015DF4FD6|nr:phage late control D family protein [Stenotrophomonas maltophilia]MBA0361610.1 phage late control D family protein [Stenotrophomonas maltophilia]
MRATPYPIPAWRVVLDGQDLTARLAPRLLDLSLTESRGDEADQVDLRVHDHDGMLALPRRGVTLQVAIGFEGSGLFDKGTFKVDDVEHSGSPDIITIRARSADLTGAVRRRRERSWHDTTLGDILGAIAGEHSLRTSVAADLASVAIAHLDQANESDINLLTRLGKRFDAVATVKAGTLIFAPIGAGTTASGQPLPGVRITRASGDQHRYSVADREKYTGVRAYWSDRRAARRTGVLVGTSANEKKLQATYANAQEARQHAEAEFKRLDRGTAQLSYRLAIGRADIYPEQTVTVSGFKPEIDGTDWLVAKATHTIDGSGGFVTALELERGGEASAKPSA